MAFPEDVLKRLHVRMCGPEVESEAWSCELTLPDGRPLRMELRPGLYHDAFPAGGADIIVAMNAGIGVPQYRAEWAPTLDLFGRMPQRFLLAVTTYSPGELLREEQLLRRRYGTLLKVRSATALAELLDAVGGKPPWTIAKPTRLASGLDLEPGDVLEPWLLKVSSTQRRGQGRSGVEAVVVDLSDDQREGVVHGPWCFRLLRARDLQYVGPNPTPGRSRNYGKFLLWVDQQQLRTRTL
eukprot:TRINITY_DN20669_c0_g1_i7.p1 TRINITY_DN20669_c0_g1~~TRINITY_DN20669_c0_g1_i7.p1  ORF type:complete len:239 (-),score=36.28 TRINITY_DN20669_c0_g1_i7:14-730(-)